MSRLRVERLERPGVSVADLAIEDGTGATLHGASGSGKTLLLRAIADLDAAEGEVWLDDRARSGMRAPLWRRQVMYIASESHWWARRVREHAADWPTDDLQALGLNPEVLGWEIQRLSSGERQRLALVRAISHSPSVLLLDEPTANLDTANTERVERLVEAWRGRTGGCVFWVSHDPGQRARVATAHYRVEDGRVSPSDAA
jgi:ABC-type iron transport system FetAB ATPase subunit